MPKWILNIFIFLFQKSCIYLLIKITLAKKHLKKLQMIEFISLNNLNNIIKDVIYQGLEQTYWVIAEIGQINSNYSGHAYLELVEKEENSGKIIAKSRATIWSSKYRIIRPYFESVTGYELQSEIKILVKVIVEFHEIYGLSLNVIDIEPAYTLGDIEKRRLEIIKNLEESGVFEMNKEIEFPIVPQRIAIISSKTAAGYEDFINQLENNVYNYKFYYKLFPAIVQGNQAEETIICALDKIFENENNFDIVVIIRGGGSKTDLSCFDSENLAFNICQFPLPVITGIGHERDISIADLVAHTSKKTPTAVAEFIIQKVNEFENELIEKNNYFCGLIEDLLSTEKNYLQNLSYNFTNLVNKYLSHLSKQIIILEKKFENSSYKYIENKKHQIKNLTSKSNEVVKYSIISKKENIKKIENELNYCLNKFLIKKKHEIEIFDKIIQYQHPDNVLKRGYSITKINNKAIKNAQEVQEGDIIETEVFSGKITSKVIDK